MNKISEDLEFLKQKIVNIESNMIDIDCVLTPQENANLDESLRELEEGKITSLEDFEKERKNVEDWDFKSL